MNPAVTLGLVAAGNAEFVPGIKVDALSVLTYLSAQMVGAFIGAVLCWLAYKKQFDQEADPAVKLGVFSTGPEVRDYVWNLVTEILGTFVLVFVVLASGNWGDSATKTPAGLGWLGALGVALLVVGIGGQGVMTATEILAEAAIALGHDAKKTEVAGMAQRGGVQAGAAAAGT